MVSVSGVGEDSLATEGMLPSRPPIVLAITGASGVIYGLRLLQVLVHRGRTMELLISPAAREVIRHELGINLDLSHFDPASLGPWLSSPQMPAPWGEGTVEAGGPSPSEVRTTGRIRYWRFDDLDAPLASGSVLTDGMVICPCSLATLAAIVHGLSDNLIRRAAEVHLKEGRRLIVVPRETPLSPIQLRNLYLAARHGITVLPAMPGFYHRPASVGQLVDFLVARICDHFGEYLRLVERWDRTSSEVRE
jgi:4-hydroxy-3-polyprenylbenzoate decarboxylase